MSRQRTHDEDGHANERALRRRVMLAATMTAGLVLGSVTAVVAVHQFNDVPTDHAFHDEISAIADAGITTGFADGGFHPSADVTRQAMAAFMERGLGRAAYGEGGPVFIGNEVGGGGVVTAPIAEVTIEAGATGSGTGFVVLQGDLSVRTHQSSNAAIACPCEIEGWISDGVDFSESINVAVGTAYTESGYSFAGGSVGWVVPIAAGETKVFTLHTHLWDADLDVTSVDGTLTAVYIPFGPTGSSELFPAGAGSSTRD